MMFQNNCHCDIKTSYSLLGKPRKYLSHYTGHKHRMPTCITECLDNVEEAVQSQYSGRCALRDGFVTIFDLSPAFY